MTPALFARTASRGRWKLANHLCKLDESLVDVANGDCKRLVVEFPPRHGKSELVGRYFPAWFLGTFPDKQVMYCSYEAKQARKYGRFARNVMQECGQEYFGVSVAEDSHAADMWNIEGREGGMVTAGIGGPLTGKGAQLLIADDPIKNAEEAVSEHKRNTIWDWWESTALTRLEPGGAVIIVMTRWHKDDLAGRSVREMADEGWRVLKFPALAEANDPLDREEGEALWPERFSREDLEKVRDNRSLYWWLALYQQRPTKHASVEWPSEYFEDCWFEAWPECGVKVITLDPSKGRTKHSDYSAYVMLGRGVDGCYYVDADLDRRSAGQIVDDGVELCRQFRPEALGIEENAWQDLLADMMTPRLHELNMIGIDVHTIGNYSVAKENRIRRIDPYLRNRRIKFRNTPGCKLLVNQLSEFPLAQHDDGPDALEMALRWAESMFHDSGEPQDEYVSA